MSDGVSKLPLLSIAAFALVIAACATAPTAPAPDPSSDTESGNSSASSASSEGSTTQTTSSPASTDAGTSADAAAVAAENLCYTTCIDTVPQAKAIDDAWVVCKNACTNGDCVAACNTASDTLCAQAANHPACLQLGACWTQCFGTTTTAG